MGMWKRTRLLCLVIGIAATGCAPSASPSPGAAARESVSTGAAPSGSGPATPTRVTLIAGIEPSTLTTKRGSGGPFRFDYFFPASSPLVILEPTQGAPRPLLAAELPSRDNGSWILNADGTMTTRWRIRPNAVWHDGRPVTATDFVFAHRVYLDARFDALNRTPEQLIERVEPVDERTFVLHWKQVYPWADRLIQGQLEPLPEHLLGTPYAAGDVPAFLNDPYWATTAFVGTGPYRLVDWQKGDSLTFRAFDQYFMGRPKIDELVIREITDPNAVVANVLSGGVDLTGTAMLNLQGGLTVKQQWELSGEGRIDTGFAHFRYMDIQRGPGRTQQPALNDLRVRRAILHGIDRAAVTEVGYGSYSAVTEVFMYPNDPLRPRVDQAAARYPFDIARALALLQEAGWNKQGDLLINAAGQPFPLDLSATQTVSDASMVEVVAANLSTLGMQTTQTAIPQARQQDREYRSNFAGLSFTGAIVTIPQDMAIWTADQCPVAANQWSGSNRGCWSNPDYERLFRIGNGTLDEAERANAVVEMNRIITNDVGVLGFTHHVNIFATRKGLIGPTPSWPTQTGATWNIHEWRWQ